MGVPVITLAGTTCVSRQGASLLSHLGLQELIAATQDSYVDIATGLARDLDKLQQLRKGLRDRMRRSTLTDAYRFTRSLEALYRRIWESWCIEQTGRMP
jgi:predicted O-linked N-acetylglucosamine transferase (SPINDLY family)